MAVSDDGHHVYAVGNYTPPGNYVGDWNQNVPAPVNGKIWVPDRSEYILEMLTDDVSETSGKVPHPQSDWKLSCILWIPEQMRSSRSSYQYDQPTPSDHRKSLAYIQSGVISSQNATSAASSATEMGTEPEMPESRCLLTELEDEVKSQVGLIKIEGNLIICIVNDLYHHDPVNSFGWLAIWYHVQQIEVRLSSSCDEFLQLTYSQPKTAGIRGPMEAEVRSFWLPTTQSKANLGVSTLHFEEKVPHFPFEWKCPVKRAGGGSRQKTTVDSFLSGVDLLYCNIPDAAVCEAIFFDSGENVLSFRPSSSERAILLTS
ncbi:unnamed protein product [Protopolystoma xenopodis]|uniref:Uncharacterized protein n=1 Tax=Protopolystoma xenopodis TaxID=117903 RepID=A0A3S5B4X3_9PLAT|nr:unnamed protein product [Protopolystoma xenopodis]